MIEVYFEEIDEVPGINSEFLVFWLSQVVKDYECELGDLCFIFCSDEYLLEMNKTHLNHDYYTDIITFDYTDGKKVSGDLFISLDRVKDNAHSLDLSFNEELNRVCVHGVLHLCGLKDKSDEESSVMRSAENKALAYLKT